MTSLKDHQSAMVQLLASGTAIPTSASRLAHALHDVLAYLNNTNAAPVAHTERRIDATTPGLNDAALAEDVKAVKPKQQSLESLLKQRDNTIRQLKCRVADLVKERDHFKGLLGADPAYFGGAEQSGCRKDDTHKHGWFKSGVVNGHQTYSCACGATTGYDPTQDDGRIEWCGVECPVAPDTEVTVELR